MDELTERLSRTEARMRRLRWIAGASLGLHALVLTLALAPAGGEDELVVRSLTVVDGKGTPRVVLGAPLPSSKDGERISASTGMAILDANGLERFGVGLMENGQLGMGFDAAPGVGSDANRERLYLGVTPDGRGYLNVKDGRTRVRMHVGTIDESGESALMFVDWSDGSPEYVELGLEEVRALAK